MAVTISPLFFLFICTVVLVFSFSHFVCFAIALLPLELTVRTPNTLVNVYHLLFIYLFGLSCALFFQPKKIYFTFVAFVGGGRINYSSALLNVTPHRTVKQFYNRQHCPRTCSRNNPHVFVRFKYCTEFVDTQNLRAFNENDICMYYIGSELQTHCRNQILDAGERESRDVKRTYNELSFCHIGKFLSVSQLTLAIQCFCCRVCLYFIRKCSRILPSKNSTGDEFEIKFRKS